MVASGIAVPDSGHFHSSRHQRTPSNTPFYYGPVRMADCDCYHCLNIDEDEREYNNPNTYISNQSSSTAMADIDSEHSDNEEEGSSDEGSYHANSWPYYGDVNRDEDFILGDDREWHSNVGLFDNDWFDRFRPTRIITRHDFVSESADGNGSGIGIGDDTSSCPSNNSGSGDGIGEDSSEDNGDSSGSSSGNDTDHDLHDSTLEHPYYDVALSLIQDERLRISVLEAVILEVERRRVA